MLLHAASTGSGPRGQKGIAWGQCTEFNSSEPIQCANLTVPLDYTLPNSSETIELQLLRIPAVRQPSKGSILFNFGGPGVEGRDTMARDGAWYRNSTSEYHDLVTFDPRGTGNTLFFSCFEDNNERNSYISGYFGSWSFLSTHQYTNSSDTNPGRLWASAKLFVDKCYEKNKARGGVYGTAFVVRDMLQIVDALDEDGLLRYWGASYGTLLGQTAAAMFPERIDKMVLEANINGHEYYNTFDEEQSTDADKAFSAIFQWCIANPYTCALAERNMTAAQLEEAAYALIDELNSQPIPFGTILIDYNMVKSAISSALGNPNSWRSVTGQLNALMDQNYDSFIDILSSGYWFINPLIDPLTDSLIDSDSSSNSSSKSDALKAIACGDKIARVSSLDDFLPIMATQMGKSRILGDGPIMLEMMCAQWRLNAKERYSGDFGVKTRSPILFIGTTADAITPLVSARNMSAAFEGSVVLHVNDYGHGLVSTSTCANKVTADYLVNGTLPENETFCELDEPIVLEASGDGS
ncbi:nedd8-like protein [Colletotrichum karsti]|uniref:Nedd8-like protein n=1 Tax=Colletotrichum karsti TaxID=1095194 RepID=A0A9P6ID21_9PEZI|nr:nedd8-like protein [Colletotrichum karsti]KAF9878316.1 nedd8-like protein [Colletotrichum karsti]